MTKDKDIKVVSLMIGMYCHGKHKSKRGTLCSQCQELLDFVAVKRDKCPYGDDKDYCSACKIHCYRSDPIMRQRIKEVMRYAAPRMCFTHPILTISHLKSTIRKKMRTRKEQKKAAKQND